MTERLDASVAGKETCLGRVAMSTSLRAGQIVRAVVLATREVLRTPPARRRVARKAGMMPRMKRASAVRLAQILFLTCVMCACGAKHGSAGNEYFPCSLLTAQEVSAGLGEKIQQLQPLPPDKCRYLPDNPLDFITVKAAPSGALALFKGSKIAGHMMGLKPSGQSAGVGDESFWSLSVIWVRKGDAYMSINMTQAPVDQQQVGLRLARIAAARL